jgi:plasmid stabilization system protein ParE
MKFKILYLELAQKDAREIGEYLLQFPGASKKFFDLLKERIELLGDMPYLFEQYPDNPSYRKIVVSNYLVFYKVNAGKGSVEIHRILHGARDIKKYVPAE